MLTTQDQLNARILHADPEIPLYLVVKPTDEPMSLMQALEHDDIPRGNDGTRILPHGIDCFGNVIQYVNLLREECEHLGIPFQHRQGI